MKIFVFGIGQYFKNRKKQFFEISSDDTLIGFLDNQADKCDKYEGKPVFLPSVVTEVNFERIILMSTYYQEIYEQLMSLGVPTEKIYFWEQYRAEKTIGENYVYIRRNEGDKNKKSILLTTPDLGYHGGSISIVSAAEILISNGYRVWVVAGSCDSVFLQEIIRHEINIAIVPSLPYVSNEFTFFLNQFDVVIVNVFSMIKLACDISHYKPVLWWLHESDWGNESIYNYIRYQFSKYDNVQAIERIKIFAVSEVAKEAFEIYYPHRISAVLPFGIVDKGDCNISEVMECDKFVFTIIGSVSRLKAQLDFLKAANMFSDNIKNKCEFWIIGDCGEDEYANEVRKFAQTVQNVKFLGIMQRKDLNEAFQRIDCVVCASQVETMSLTIVEGMMHGRMCITTDQTGIAGYMKDGINGFVYRAGDVVALSDCMKKAFDMRNNSYEIRKNARKLYEDEFSMERFGERLEHALSETEKYYHERYANE